MDDVKIAIYIRLSLADEETGKSKDESNSIINQRSLIHRFLDENEELKNYPRTEFVDDGYTGKNSERPAFQRMINQIREGKYTLCITKDFSRFSRDYIEMGDYLECLFPFLNIRYISINDGYDSEVYKGTTGGLDVVMRAIIYDTYSKDLSVKVKSGMRQSRMKGNRTSGTPAYGYMPDPEKRGRDILDPETAPIVRRIFDEALAGRKAGTIARGLNDDGVKTPSQHFAELYPENRKYRTLSEKQAWTNGMIYPILHRMLYTGASVGGLTKKPSPCSKQNIKTPREEWVIVQDMHTPIITAEEYEKVQSLFDLEKVHERSPRFYPLKSLVYCGNCGRHMHREKNKYYCPYGRYGMNEGCKCHHSPRERDMEKIVYDAIRNIIMAAEDKTGEKKYFAPTRLKGDEKCIAELENQIRLLKRSKLTLYEQYCNADIAKAEYIKEKALIDSALEEREKSIIKHRKRNEEDKGKSTGFTSEKEAACKIFADMTDLSYDMAHAFIDRIIIYNNERLEIVWRFKEPNIYTYADVSSV